MAILHIITGLNRAGAETQLSRVVGEWGCGHAVFSICVPGDMENELKARGIPVYSGGVKTAYSLRWILKLYRVVKTVNPKIICGWMYHGNLAAWMVATRKHHLIWNIRHSLHDLGREKFLTRIIIRMGSLLSKRPDAIIFNSKIALSQHVRYGYAGDSSVFIPNGFDTTKFKPSAKDQEKIRCSLNIDSEEKLIGVVGRNHPMKNYIGLLNALALADARNRKLRVIIVGSGVVNGDNNLRGQVMSFGLEEVVELRPESENTESLFPAFDCLIMPSLWGEGFPNVVGEAMACGVPCLVTDVGDAAEIVGETGFVSASGEPYILAKKIEEVSSLSRETLNMLGRRARRRIKKRYDICKITKEYKSLFQNIELGVNEK